MSSTDDKDMISVFQKLTEGHSRKRELFVQRERGRKQEDMLRKLQVAAAQHPGVWGTCGE